MISKFPLSDRKFHLCGIAINNPDLKPYHFYYLNGASIHLSSLTISQENIQLTKVVRFILAGIIGSVVFLLITGLMGFSGFSLFGFLYTMVTIGIVLPGILVYLYANGQFTSVPISFEQRTTLQIN